MFVNKIINFFKLALIPIVTLGYSTASYGLSISQCLEKISTDDTFKNAIKDVLTGREITNHDDDPQHQQNMLCTYKDNLLKPIADAIHTNCPENMGYLFKERGIDYYIQYEDYTIRFKPQQIFEHLNATIGILASKKPYTVGQEVPNHISNWASDPNKFHLNCSKTDDYFKFIFNTPRGFWTDNIIDAYFFAHLGFAMRAEDVLFFPGLVLSLDSSNVYLASGNTPRETYETMQNAANKSHASICNGMKYYLVMIGFEDGGYNKKITNTTRIGNTNNVSVAALPSADPQYKIEKVMILSEGIPVKL